MSVVVDVAGVFELPEQEDSNRMTIIPKGKKADNIVFFMFTPKFIIKMAFPVDQGT
jgi:hypothetical protein